MTYNRQRAAQIHRQIKQFYLNNGRTQQQWQAVSQHPGKFNKVWRAMLRLPINDKPPPESYRA